MSNPARLWRSLGALGDAAYAKAGMSGGSTIGINEKHIGRGSGGARRGRVLHVSEGCKGENVATFFTALREHGGYQPRRSLHP